MGMCYAMPPSKGCAMGRAMGLCYGRSTPFYREFYRTGGLGGGVMRQSLCPVL